MSLVVSWIPPLPLETLDNYARRLTVRMDPGKPCVVIGVSFGGLVVLEVARHLKSPLACVLINSARSVRSLPPSVRALRPISRLLPRSAMNRLMQLGAGAAATTIPRMKNRVRLWSSADFAFRRWAMQVLLHWQPPPLVRCPVYQIHGEFDSVFSPPADVNCYHLTGAGHLATITHAEAVNDALRDILGRLSSTQTMLH